MVVRRDSKDLNTLHRFSVSQIIIKKPHACAAFIPHAQRMHTTCTPTWIQFAGGCMSGKYMHKHAVDAWHMRTPSCMRLTHGGMHTTFCMLTTQRHIRLETHPLCMLLANYVLVQCRNNLTGGGHLVNAPVACRSARLRGVTAELWYRLHQLWRAMLLRGCGKSKGGGGE